MAGDGEARSRPRLAPVEQQCAPSHPRDPGRQRDLFVEVEDPRRVDQRGDEQRRRALAAMVADAGSIGARDLGPRRRPRHPRRMFIGLQPGEGLPREPGLMLRHLAQQFQEQRKRPRRSGRSMLMLHCTMLR